MFRDIFASGERLARAQEKVSTPKELWGNYFKKKMESAPKTSVAVVYPCDEVSLQGAIDACGFGIDPILIGPAERILRVAEKSGLRGKLEELKIKIVDSQVDYNDEDLAGKVKKEQEEIKKPAELAAAKLAAESVLKGEAQMIGKGSLHTSNYLSGAVIPVGKSIKKAREAEQPVADDQEKLPFRISHTFIFGDGDPENGGRLLFMTDPAINQFPTVEEKLTIAKNAIDAAIALGIKRPKVAVLNAVELTDEKNQSTIDAAEVARRGNEMWGDIADFSGPISADLALSSDSAQIKGFSSPVAGGADIFLYPDINSANIAAKTLSYFRPDMLYAGAVLGGGVPAGLTSRSDSAENRKNSLLVSSTIAAGMNRKK